MDIRELGKAVLLEFCRKWGTSRRKVRHAVGFRWPAGAQQMHVDCLLNHKDCLRAVRALACAVPPGVGFWQLDIPAGVEGIVVAGSGVSLRVLTTYSPLDGRHIVRIDALFV